MHVDTCFRTRENKRINNCLFCRKTTYYLNQIMRNRFKFKHSIVKIMLKSEEKITIALSTSIWTKHDMDNILSANVGQIPRVRLINQTNSVNYNRDFNLLNKN